MPILMEIGFVFGNKRLMNMFSKLPERHLFLE